MKYLPLTAYRVTYDDGTSRVTDMAATVTLQMARDYFLGHRFEITETTFHTAIAVEQVTGPAVIN